MSESLLFSVPLPTAFTVASALVLGLAVIALLLRKSGGQSKGSAAGQAASSSHARAAAPPVEAADSRQKCVILFGTQTGTAERFAKSLRAQLDSKYGGGTAFEVLDIEQYDAAKQLPQEHLVFLLMATYGDGDPTDSATEFWTWLSEAAEGGAADDLLQVRCGAACAVGWEVLRWPAMPGGLYTMEYAVLQAQSARQSTYSNAVQQWAEELPAVARQRLHNRLCAAAAPAFPLTLSFPLICLPGLQGVSFGVFGLGNRQYEHFCAMGKKVSKAMQALGAAEVVPRGEGDDDKDIDDDFDAWSARLFAALDASPLVAKNKVRGVLPIHMLVSESCMLCAL